MTLEEAIARLNDNNIHEIILAPNQLQSWLEELKELREKFDRIEKLVKEYENVYQR